MTHSIVTIQAGHGYRIIRRVRVHRPNTLQRLWTLIWSGGKPEQVHARQLRLSALAREYQGYDYMYDPRRLP